MAPHLSRTYAGKWRSLREYCEYSKDYPCSRDLLSKLSKDPTPMGAFVVHTSSLHITVITICCAHLLL